MGNPLVDEVPDGDPLRNLQDRTEMVGMKVRRDEIVDLLEPGVRARPQYPVGVAMLRPERPGVDQDGFARRRDDQCRAAAEHIEKIDFEGPWPCLLGGGRPESDEEHEQHAQDQQSPRHDGLLFSRLWLIPSRVSEMIAPVCSVYKGSSCKVTE